MGRSDLEFTFPCWPKGLFINIIWMKCKGNKNQSITKKDEKGNLTPWWLSTCGASYSYLISISKDKMSTQVGPTTSIITHSLRPICDQISPLCNCFIHLPKTSKSPAYFYAYHERQLMPHTHVCKWTGD